MAGPTLAAASLPPHLLWAQQTSVPAFPPFFQPPIPFGHVSAERALGASVVPLAFSVVLISVTLCVTEMKCPKPTFCRIFTMLHLCPFPCSLHGITDEQVPGGPTCPHYRQALHCSLAWRKNILQFSSEKHEFLWFWCTVQKYFILFIIFN